MCFLISIYVKIIGSETVHKDLELFRNTSTLNRNIYHPKYEEFFLKCTEMYNSSNDGDQFFFDNE